MNGIFVATRTRDGRSLDPSDAPLLFGRIDRPRRSVVWVGDPPAVCFTGWAASTRARRIRGVVRMGGQARQFFECDLPRPRLTESLGPGCSAHGFAVTVELPTLVTRAPVEIHLDDGELVAISSTYELRSEPPVFVTSAPDATTTAALFADEWWQVPGIDDPAPWLSAALDALGGIEGMRVLELGPGDGVHTVVLERAGAAEVVAVEANLRAYLRCLVRKELAGLRRSTFLLGDLAGYLRDADRTFDLVVASDVLVHLREPVAALQAISCRAPRLLVRTEVFDGRWIDRQIRLRERFVDDPYVRDLDGLEVQLHPRRYGNERYLPSFNGGLAPTGAWMTRDDLERVLKKLGYRIRSLDVVGETSTPLTEVWIADRSQ